MNIAYVAGLFDGEGYIRIATRRKNANHLRMQLYAGIGMTYRPVIEELQRSFGGSRSCNDHSKRNPKHRPQHVWNVCSVQAAQFLRKIYPFLSVKREEVKLALEFQDSIDQWRGKLGNRNPASYTDARAAVWAYRLDLANRMSELKHVRYDPNDPLVQQC